MSKIKNSLDGLNSRMDRTEQNRTQNNTKQKKALFLSKPRKHQYYLILRTESEEKRLKKEQSQRLE